MRWLSNIPTMPLAIIALLLAFAPFQPEPHLLEKLRMLSDGTLVRAVDIFDLLLHGLPLILLLIKLSLSYRNKKGAP